MGFPHKVFMEATKLEEASRIASATWLKEKTILDERLQEFEKFKLSFGDMTEEFDKLCAK